MSISSRLVYMTVSLVFCCGPLSFKYLFQALVRPHLEYAAAVWSPYKSGEIEQIGNVQRKATKQMPSLKNMEYNQRLRKLNMPTLKRAMLLLCVVTYL
jgi:hypothetical protein